MNLKNLSEEILLSRTKQIANQEREILISMLHHLRENERRRLFSKLKYPSLFEYAVHELKYSESQAIRRISAMRLMKEIPELERNLAVDEEDQNVGLQYDRG